MITQDLNSTTLAGEESQVSLDLDSFILLNDAIVSNLRSFVGFCIYAVIFGLSLAACGLSMFYLLKRWKKTSSHMIVTVFTFVISSYNVALFVMRAVATAASLQDLICPAAYTLDTSYMLKPKYNGLLSESRDVASNSGVSGPLVFTLIPIFLWVTDAFILYRTWSIWVRHRKYVVVPALAFLASLISEIIWLVQVLTGSINRSTVGFYSDLARWIPALGFSCGINALITGMIVGRLVYHHQKRKKLTEKPVAPGMPIMTIFIESAALSLISKIVQLAIPSHAAWNPIVVPLCTIATNLIVLRKALGGDAGEMMARKQDLSTLARFRPRRPHTGLKTQDNDPAFDASIPGGFSRHLIQTIGGHTIEIDHFDDDDSEQASISNVPKE